MPGGRRDGPASGGNAARAQNGNRGSFRTDTAISNSRHGQERVLQPWVPDANISTDGGLEKSGNSGGAWDQFAENERLFGLKTDYDENIYTTSINKSHPKYHERAAHADKKAKEIERSTASTAHVAEERVMDHVAGNGNDGENEEDKYSGVRRQEFPPLGGRENKYTPPAMRPPTGQATVAGAPVDPAIISSQIKAPAKKQSLQTPDEVKSQIAAMKNGIPKAEVSSSTQNTVGEDKPASFAASASSGTVEASVADKSSTSGRNSTSNSRILSPEAKESAPSATSTVERDVLKSFKDFASQQRENHQKARSSKAKADKEVKLTELKKFASNFKLSTPVPGDLVSIIAKDPAKQKEIQAKAMKDAEEIAKSKTDAGSKDVAVSKESSKASEQTGAKNSPDPRAPRGPSASQIPPQGGAPNRGQRQQYPQQAYAQYNNHRGGPRHGNAQQQTGTLTQRLRNIEREKFSQQPQGPLPHQHIPIPDGRMPPAGPATAVDRRLSGVANMGAKLNPSSQEFRPTAATFTPAGHPSAGSSPRSSVNQAVDVVAPIVSGQLIRRKTKAIDPKKCCILSHIQTITPPQGRNWDENGGLRPSFDTLPTWRQLKDDENSETMRLTYTQYFERRPFAGSMMATPNPPHVVPHIAHQHQLPFHLQQGGPRQSPHMSQMPMHTPQHVPGPHQPYSHDDHRMVHSNSAQSFASPRLGQAAMAYPGMNSPQVPYNQQVFMGPGTPQMGPFRSFSGNPQYMAAQQGQMGGHMMMQPPFMAGPQGMVGGPQMMYPGHPHFMPPNGPPQPGPGANGYPSPGRPAAPMMAHQGSQQGQPMYGMSPGMQYSQPAYGHGQQQPGGPMSRTYSNTGSQQYGASPQQSHQHSAHHHQQRSGSNTYSRNHSAQGQLQPSSSQGSHATQPASGPGRGTEGSDESK